MKKEMDRVFGDEQDGFRQEKSYTDQIVTLRIIIEQTIEWQTSLYLTFIDFEKAFDSIAIKYYGAFLDTMAFLKKS